LKPPNLHVERRPTKLGSLGGSKVPMMLQCISGAGGAGGASVDPMDPVPLPQPPTD